MRTSVIIPAYNEAPRVAAVLEVVKAATLVQDILVVDDGSQDDTATVAEREGVRVLRLPRNRGKGSALRAGTLSVSSDLVLFLDADLRGLTPAQVDDLIRPVATKQADMTIGVFRGGRTATDLAQSLCPNISGQRCLARDVFLATPLVEGCRSGVEIAMTVHARACKLTIATVPLAGATHPMKEEKLGTIQGFLARMRMYVDIVVTLCRYHLTPRHPGKAPVGNE